MNRNILKSERPQGEWASHPYHKGSIGVRTVSASSGRDTAPLALGLGKCVLFLAVFVVAHGGAVMRTYGQTLYTWEVNGVAGSTSTLNAATSASNISGGQLSLTGLTATAANTFGGSGWNTTDTFNDANDYFSFSVTPASGYEVTYSDLKFSQGVTSTAPNTSRWGYKIVVP